MSQTTGYNQKMDPAQQGQKYDIRPDVVASMAAEEAVPFGVAVKRGTKPGDQVIPIDTAAEVFYGISLFTHTVENAYNNGVVGGTPQYGLKDTVSVLRVGAVWVTVFEAVVPGDTAYAGITGNAGKFGKTASTNIAINGKFVTAADTNGLAVVEFDAIG